MKLLLPFQANARVSRLATIAENLKYQVDSGKETKKELEKIQNEFKEFREATQREDKAQNELFEQVKKGQEGAAKEVERLQEENRKLREELKWRPTAEKVLEGFRGTPTYYTELNDKSVEKIKL